MAPKKASSSKKPVTATLLSGFLGSGKTSLMRHVLTNKQGLRCAVVVNEISELNLDADALMGTKLIKADETLVEMANGCICCTLREDLLKQLRELSSSGKFDCVLIESSGISEPMQVAETFFVDLHDGHGQLQSKCALDNCVTVVDASTFMSYMSRIDTVSSIDASAKETEDDRDIAQLFVDQLEFANVVILNKTDLIKGPDREDQINALKALVHKISPKAKIILGTHSRVPLNEILNTGNFTLEFANSHGEWMEDIKSGVKHVPETLEYGVSSYMFRATKPFHPTRLYNWMTHNFVLNQMKVIADDDDEEDDDATSQKKAVSLEDKRQAIRAEEQRKVQQEMRDEATRRKMNCTASYGNLFRGKGFIWIGSPERDPIFGVWSQAGTLLSLNGGSTWDELPQPNDRCSRANQKPQQLLAFVGQNLNAAQLEADLQGLLMTDAEHNALKKHLRERGPIGTLYEDKFERWVSVEEGSDDEEEEEEEEDTAYTHSRSRTSAKAKGKAAPKAKAAGKKKPAAAAAAKKEAKAKAKTVAPQTKAASGASAKAAKAPSNTKAATKKPAAAKAKAAATASAGKKTTTAGTK